MTHIPTTQSANDVTDPMTNRASAIPPKIIPKTIIPKTMQAVVAPTYGGTDVLSIDEVPTPVPTKGQLLVRVETSSANALDWHFLTGTPYVLRLMEGLRRPKRTIHGADVAGTVVALGPDVDGIAIGDAVFGECKGGGFAEYASVEVSRVVSKPADVSFAAAGATPVAGLTALQGLRTHGATQPGDHVLINGAAGGVGTFGVQIAKALGANVTAVCSTPNVAMVRALGADRVIDYLQDDFVAMDHRFDVMLDNVGNRSAPECLSLLTSTARYVAISGPKTNRWFGPIPHVVKTARMFRRASQSFHQFTTSPNHDDLNFLAMLLSTGLVVPEIDRSVGLHGVIGALDEIGTGHTRSKIVITPHLG